MAGISEIYRNVLGSDLSQCVENSKVLVVGAGGIGCELLKNLVLTGFKDIEVVSIQTEPGVPEIKNVRVIMSTFLCCRYTEKSLVTFSLTFY